jgi:secreted PhoX family phosphatase
MRTCSRRRWLQAAASLVAAGLPRVAAASQPAGLVSDPAGILDLPRNFTYRVLSRVGQRMSDGYRVPGNPDAMGAFQVGDNTVLMRNHEVAPGDRASGPFGSAVAPKEAYDPEAYGGVTRLVIDRVGAVQGQQLALCGTHFNCAGGLSPFGWLSCEEIFIERHGYVFLCGAEPGPLKPAQRIPQYGRFRHEAATIDPLTHIAYLTEDREDAAFYRFLPDHIGKPFVGRFQALRILGQKAFDTSAMTMGDSLRVDWVDVPQPDSDQDDVRLRAQALGAARFARTEGVWLAGRDLYLSATAGGPIGRGQIFRLRHGAVEPRLSLLVQSTDPNLLDMPDNITVAPNGDLFAAEDGFEGNMLRRISPTGEIYDFARNVFSTSEFAGPCFSPDGRQLFVNIQHDGLTLAIEGPFSHTTGVPARPGSGSGLPSPPGWAGVGAGLTVLALAALAARKRQNAAGAASEAPSTT